MPSVKHLSSVSQDACTSSADGVLPPLTVTAQCVKAMTPCVGAAGGQAGDQLFQCKAGGEGRGIGEESQRGDAHVGLMCIVDKGRASATCRICFMVPTAVLALYLATTICCVTDGYAKTM
jgi:hypothetical protein